MPTPLLIGISARIYHPGPAAPLTAGVFSRTLHYLEQSVAHWALSADVLGLMIPAVESESIVRRSDVRLAAYAEALDGLILQGGSDVAPQTYREEPIDPRWPGDIVRDRYEMQLFQAFLAAGKPVMGICRGCQLINVALGGTLYQDIPTQLPEAIVHNDLDMYEKQLHLMTIEPGTGLAALFPGRQRAAVNSIHHQAVKDLGRDLAVEATAIPDGMVEAIRWRGPSYVFGMQWHPEFLAQGVLHDEQLDGTPILEEFLGAVRERKERGEAA